MSQAPLTIADGSGSTVLSEMSNALQALASQNSASGAPSTMYGYMLWVDTSTTPATLRMRNGANNAWITLGTCDTANLGLVTQQNLQNAAHDYAVDTGTATAYAIALAPAVTAYSAGQWFIFKAVNANTGAATLNINGAGAKNIVRRDGSALIAGDIPAGAVCEVVYDGTNFQLASVDARYTRNSAAAITGGAIDNTVIGGTTPAVGTFTTLTANNPGTSGNQVVNFSQFANSKANSGYQKLPNGLIIQWVNGISIPGSGGAATVTLPVTFPTAALAVVPGVNNSAAQMIGFAINSTSSITLYTGVSDTAARTANMVVIGY